MRRITLAKSALAVGLAAACAWTLMGCSAQSGDVKLTGGVAATVNGVEIPEDEVTMTVESVRSDQSMTDEESWGKWMAQYGYTPESVREEVLDGLINQEILLQNAESRGVAVDDATVDENVQSMKSNYESDEKWQEALSSVGITEDEYRENIKLSLLYQGVTATFEEESAPTDDSLMETAKTYMTYYDGAKRSSHILFDAADEATAQEVLNQINAGALDFATAAQEYSKDTGSASQGGDVGWDKLAQFVTEYTDALADLDEGQVSGLVKSSYGIHVIKCTQVFNAPEELTSLDQIPAEFLSVLTDMVKKQNQQTAYSDWLKSCRDNSEVVINDLPKNVSYNLDISKYNAELGDTVPADGEDVDAGSGDESQSDAEEASASVAEN